MKILFIGAATSNHTIRWVNALSKNGNEVLLLSRKDQKDEKNRISPTVKVHYLKFGGGIGYYLNSFETKKIIKSFKPDVINAHYASGYGTLARIAHCKPLVLSVWGSDVYDFPWKKKRNRKLVCKNLNYADQIASTSYAMANETRRVLGNPKKEITVTPFGVDINIFKPSIRNLKEEKVIGIVKYLEPIYDIPLLINAFTILHNIRPKTILHIYGDGKLKNEMVELCKANGIEKNVIFFGTIPNTEVSKAINSMDVFVNCSKQESFGVAIVEAMACGVPVVATDCEGYKEIIENKKDGIIIERREPKLLADAILFLLDNQDIAQEMTINALKKVTQLYDWHKNVLVMEDLYRKAIKEENK